MLIPLVPIGQWLAAVCTLEICLGVELKEFGVPRAAVFPWGNGK
jgi:hypothetical protein